jgi:endonuclease YncB( thermonuclease family)
MFRKCIVFAVTAAALSGANADTVLAKNQQAARLQGKVLRVLDGDTFILRLAGPRREERTIRFSAIDTPELTQSYSLNARTALRRLLTGKTVQADCYKKDPRGRDVCRVFVQGMDVGLAMLEQGAAWHFKRFESEQTPAERAAYSAAERNARLVRRGLWAKRNPMPPWDCRDALRELKVCR